MKTVWCSRETRNQVSFSRYTGADRKPLIKACDRQHRAHKGPHAPISQALLRYPCGSKHRQRSPQTVTSSAPHSVH